MQTHNIRDEPGRRAVRWEDMDKRYTVFVSSTYNDLKEHRDAVIQAIMRAGHIPLGMEAFGAANASQWSVITKTIDASDYYVLLIARRYGSINEETGLGFTEMEYDYAIQRGVPCLVFQLDEAASWPGGTATDTSADAVAKLKAFREKSSKNRMIAFWQTKSELPYMVMTALGNAFSDSSRDGWVRPTATSSAEITDELVRLGRENSELRRLVQDSDKNQTLNKIHNLLSNRIIDIKVADSANPEPEPKVTSINTASIFNQIAIRIVSSENDIPSLRKSISSYIDELAGRGGLEEIFFNALSVCYLMGVFEQVRPSEPFAAYRVNITEIGRQLFTKIALES